MEQNDTHLRRVNLSSLILVTHISRIQILTSDVYDGLRLRDRKNFPS
ncbi:MAG: hypothetical protein RMZ42_08335 [Nostoc sp. DedQUE05]|nr:hypothetical protein [Nostoc sp. DedQUE05]MDZ8091936.1 hypothetical protein [Nostoc sp. DedQUE05]